MDNPWLNSDFRLSDLTVTSQGVNNDPQTPSERTQLKILADVLSDLKHQIGPFNIASAYRTPTVNALVGGSSSSLHLQGMAADIIPLTMDIESYFTRIFSIPSIRNRLGEITLKPPHGSLHISLATSNKQAVPMILEPTGYRSLSSHEMSQYLKNAQEFVAASISPITLAIAVLTLSGAFFLYSRSKNR